MSIQLLSVSHKAAPLAVRELFAFTSKQQVRLMELLKSSSFIQETVVLSTCNRTEVYVYSEEENERTVYDKMVEIMTSMAKENQKKREREQEEICLGDYYRFYHGEKAIHHLFHVAAGLDSMVIGEDQILGQVKRAHEFAREQGMCSTYLNTLFRYAVTSSKKVKTETDLSKTSVSTATLAVKMLQDKLGSLQNKNIMIIGATGKIGNIVLKNLQSIGNVNLFVTMRGEQKQEEDYTPIAYEERYHYMNQMDGVISATISPHYTITAGHLKRYYTPHKMVFVDLAVPMDIEHEVEQLGEVFCYHMDDLEKVAQENNERKKEEAQYAKYILKDYEVQFKKWYVFQHSFTDIQRVTMHLEKEIEQKGAKKALQQFFYQVREDVSFEQLQLFLETIKEYGKKEIELVDRKEKE